MLGTTFARFLGSLTAPHVVDRAASRPPLATPSADQCVVPGFMAVLTRLGRPLTWPCRVQVSIQPGKPHDVAG
ncbi:hypothetical protein B296_00021014 [Ensete ventricosum]|uniref:Uncharacterized protein n=1 Tax=Ensete ventricosum TaxID=4639 RepID=A0A426Y6J1_ENSVE|nr:hypothetical protein B296_00021014 [Ensete ventricosum]